MNPPRKAGRDFIHHVAIHADGVAAATAWYSDTFKGEIAYEDDTWALLEFGNLSLALVTRGHHPAHLGFVPPAARSHSELTLHRDGTRSIHICDPAGNAVELLDPESVRQPSNA